MTDSPRNATVAGIDHLLDRFMLGLERVLALAFCAAVALNFVNVVARYVFNNSIHGADELQVQVLIAMAFLGAAIVQWRGQHLRMDVLLGMMPAAMKTALRVIEVVLVIVLAVFVVVQSARYTMQMHDLARASDALGMPVWISHSLVVIGFSLIVIAALWRVVSPVRQGNLR
jgi:TRAP-type C4-dicarboxylate transport system permease small subunit